MEFVNLIFASGVPSSVCSVFFRGSLFVSFFQRESISQVGGLCPIGVGLTFRRLAATIANRANTAKFAAFLAPCQLEVGVNWGCEAAGHAARSFITSCAAVSALLKIDLSNALIVFRGTICWR